MLAALPPTTGTFRAPLPLAAVSEADCNPSTLASGGAGFEGTTPAWLVNPPAVAFPLVAPLLRCSLAGPLSDVLHAGPFAPMAWRIALAARLLSVA
jgi:hypothetical protein